MNQTLRRSNRWYAQWSHETTQYVYYHIEGKEYRAMVHKGTFYTGRTRKGSAVVASLIGDPANYVAHTPMNRRVFLDAIRKLREIENQ